MAEARQLADEGCREITLLGQTVNSYKYREGDRTRRLSDLLERLHDIEGIERIKFVTNYPEGHDGRPACRPSATCPSVSKYLHVPVQSGSNDVLKRMKRGYTVEEYREMLARIARADARRRRHQRLHRRLLRRDRGRLPADDGPGPRVAASRTASSSNTASGPAPRAPSCTPTTCPKKSNAAATTSCSPCKTKSAKKTTTPSSAARSRSWSKAPAKPAEKHDDQTTPSSSNSPAAPTATESSSSTATAAKSASSCRSSIYDANAHTLFGEVVTQHAGPELFGLAVPPHRPPAKSPEWRPPRPHAIMDFDDRRSVQLLPTKTSNTLPPGKRVPRYRAESALATTRY